MKVSAISVYNYQTTNSARNKHVKQTPQENSVAFKAKGGKLLGGLLGGAAGGAAGGAIIGGGTLAGMLAMATALGPVGWGLAGLYTVGGALVGGYVGSGVGDHITGDDDKRK